MSQKHPITPPPVLVNQWRRTAPHSSHEREHYHYITLRAAQWGADQELEACCALMDDWGLDGDDLRAARRPKPPSLKKQALQKINTFKNMDTCNLDIIRRALEALPDE